MFLQTVLFVTVYKVDRKEIEETRDGHRETIEELIELKRKLTSTISNILKHVVDLKREKRLERERSGQL